MFLKKYLYTKFAEEDRKETLEKEVKKIDTKKEANSIVPKSIPKNRKKKMIISLVIIVPLLVILGVVLYNTLKPTYKQLVNIESITVVDKKTATIVANNGAMKGNIDLNSTKSYAYLTTDNRFTVYTEFSSYSAGVYFNVQQTTDGTGKLIYSVAGLLNDGTTVVVPTEFSVWLSRISTNAIVAPTPFNWMSLISILLPIVIVAVMIISYLKMSKMQGGGQESIFGMGKSGATVAKSTVKFSDVAGIQEEKNELIEIVDYLKRPAKYAAMGARTPRGVILYGPPGTGKTLLAKATAGEAGVNFFQISGSQFEDMLVGVGAKRVRDLFSKARKVAPSIIFIDEIDSVASKRGKNEFGGGLADQTINQLLAEMDGFNTSTGIVVMAATNRLDVLDDAILRPGRFDRHIQVNLPDIKEREAILKIHSKNKNISKKVSFYDIARRTPGFSGAQLENVLNEATLLAVRWNENIINEKHIDEAIDRVIAGPAKTTRTISEDERKHIAYHEAGHALIGLHTPGTDIVQKITIIPRGSAAGYTMQTPAAQELTIQKKSDLLNNVRMTLGGRASEEVVFGKNAISTGASNDLYKITNIVRAMVMQLGMSDVGLTQFIPSEGSVNPYSQKLYSESMALKIDMQIEKFIKTEYDKAIKIILKNRKELDLIVETLLILETILKDQIDYIHKHKKLPPSAIEQKNQNAKKEKEIKEINKKESKSSSNVKVEDENNSSKKKN